MLTSSYIFLLAESVVIICMTFVHGNQVNWSDIVKCLSNKPVDGINFVCSTLSTVSTASAVSHLKAQLRLQSKNSIVDNQKL